MSATTALRAAIEIRRAVETLGLRNRTGIHTGEIERNADGIAGISIHLAARILGLAAAGQILVSSVTRGLTEDAGFAFRDANTHAVKGIDRPVTIFEFDEG